MAKKPSSGRSTARKAGGSGSAKAGTTRKSASGTARRAAKKATEGNGKARVATAEPVAPAKMPKTPLSKKELAEFRQMLLEKRRVLCGDMNGMANEAFRANRQDGSGDLSTMPVHMADVGTDNYEQEFTLGLLESERQLLREIDQALDRIEKGTYGICLGTGKPIGKARLTAKPWAKYCIEYARMVEQGVVRQSTPDPFAFLQEEDDADDAQADVDDHDDHEADDEDPDPADDGDSAADEADAAADDDDIDL